MNVRKSQSTPCAADDQIALEAADVGIVRLVRGGANVELRGAARAQLGLETAENAVRLQDVLDRLAEGGRLHVNAQLALWGKGEVAGADINVQVTRDLDGRSRALRLRLIDRGEAVLFVMTPAADLEGSLLRAASHALRSPLNALLGWVHVLGLKRPEDSEVAGITARLARSTKAMLRTVNDLQDIDHLKRGKFRIETRPFQLADAIAAAVDAQTEAASLRDLRIVAPPAPECDCGIDGDPNRLRQLFEHLLRNAIHHSEPGSDIEILCERRDTDVQVRVRDHGSGLTREQIQLLFSDEPRDVPSNSAGLGAGLALAREIVARHRGSLSAESRGLAQGVTVTVSLPARIRDAQKKAG